MLELKQITKDYPAGDGQVHALRGIDLQFRKSEFVSILGPSGCGKTTMLNLIGGLDQYTSGDLVINGTSTKDFKDRDWDAYRNHSVGFVFQSYNLIPHQTVLQNVELALTLSGVSKQERRVRAQKALESVGLGDQLKKKPSEMSGGQMQRVAIARALVNDPDIILADEPTGALDTETSVQVMEILKQVAKDRLVVMVTHNPDLAEKYSTRIIRMLDGVITDDSMPVTEREREAMAVVARKKTDKKRKKPSMSFGTAFMLSLKNLFTKKGRTALTSFAGSIGIIGIALILAVSQGMTIYIDTVQEETLSSYPLTINSTTVDLTQLMTTFMGMKTNESDHERDDNVYEKPVLKDMANALKQLDVMENDLKEFKKFLDEQLADENSQLYGAVSGVQYTYDLPLMVYTQNMNGDIISSDSQTLLRSMIAEYMGADISSSMSGSSNGSTLLSAVGGSSTSTSLWQEMLSGNDGALINPVVKNQYSLVTGKWPTRYDEVVLVIDENNELDDLTLYALGLLYKEDIDEIMGSAPGSGLIDTTARKWSFDEVMAKEYRVILNSSCYRKNSTTGLYEDLRKDDANLQLLYANALKIKVVGIIRPNEDATSTMLSGSIAYTRALTEYVVTESAKAEAVEAQLGNTTTDVITGLPFRPSEGAMTDAQKAQELRDYLGGLNETEKAMAYIQIKSLLYGDELNAMVDEAVQGKSREEMELTLKQALATQMAADEEEIAAYLKQMTDEDILKYYRQAMTEYVKQTYAQAQAKALMQLMQMQGASALAQMLDTELATYTDAQCAVYYDEVLEFSDSTYEDNLLALGYVDMEDPASVNLYASSFADKDTIEDVIEAYNAEREDLKKIKYTDYVGIMMSSVTTIINAITYVLIAFVAISLIVSSIMIGVITLISVQERTKEIGILRAIGASKKNVSSMFTAETVIIGFASGLLGVSVTYLLCVPINAIINHLTGINNLDAILPVGYAAVLVAISVVLTLIAGMIPSRSAAKKDPVVALRTE